MESSKYTTTVVTAFYKINDRAVNRHPLDYYMQYGTEGTLSVKLPLVVFTDLDDVAEYVREYRRKLGYDHLTHVVLHHLTSSTYYPDLERIEMLESTNQFRIIDGSPDKDTPYFIVVTNSKFYCLERAIELDVFSTSHFAWIDFGASHVVRDVKVIERHFQYTPDKVRQMVINPYVGEDLHTYFSYVRQPIAAGLFTGGKNEMSEYCQLFRQTLSEVLDKGMFTLEQGIMGLIAYRHPELFDLYVGDYENLANGYLEWDPYYKSLSIAKIAIQKYIDKYDHQQAFHLLQYVGVKGARYWYLRCRLLADWYIADKNGVVRKSIATDVKHLIDVLRVTDKEQCDTFLQDNRHILSYYQ